MKAVLGLFLLALSPAASAQLPGGAFWRVSMSCKNTPWGTMANGASNTAYSTSLPPNVCSAVSEVRVCKNTILSGSFTLTTCSDGCSAGSTNNCDYGIDVHGSSSGTCGFGYVGACAYACSNGSRSLMTNTCVPADTTPDTFNFVDVINANLSSLTTSNTVTVTGINAAVAVSATGGAEFSIQGGAWTTSGTITSGQTLSIRLTSSSSFSTGLGTTISVGTGSDLWSVTTRAPNDCSVVGGTWAVSTNTCTAPSTLNISHGGTGVANDATAPTTGSATWSCYDGTPTLQAGATCEETVPAQAEIPAFVADDANPCTPTDYVVPSGVTKLFVQLWGAGGGAAGGYTQAYLTVTPGETLTLLTGQGGQSAAGTWATSCGGGGGSHGSMGGGGRSAIRRGGTELLTAGGGGGSGDAYSAAPGGLGGGLTGMSGYKVGSCNSTGGGGGTQSAGGAAGVASFVGVAGTAFAGGNGGVFVNSVTGVVGGDSGGGGGGGYFGGGGGGARASSCSSGDGGGGGSGYCGGAGVSSCNTYTGYGSGKGRNGRIAVTPVETAPTTTVYSSTGADQTYVVPAGVHTLLVQLWGAGAPGGYYHGDTYWGASGGFTQGYLAVTPGETITVIAGKGGKAYPSTAVYGGGGGGGGAGGGGRSAVRRGSTELMTAGGAGGGRGGSSMAGGVGGGVGGNGAKCDHSSGTISQSGGNGGAGGICNTRDGSNGTAFTGGTGGSSGATSCTDTHKCGGGGGGGYMGGGGGGGRNSDYSGAGAGGSGYCGGAGVTHCVTLDNLGAHGGVIDGLTMLYQSGDGKVMITPFP